MNYAEIKKYDVANGPGVRMSLFVSGCDHHCKNCFNPETWDYNYGEPFTKDTVLELLKLMAPKYISGLSLLGGDPLMPNNIRDVTALCIIVKKLYPDKSIWCYTGYNWEYLMAVKKERKYLEDLLSHIDVLVDGAFIEEEKDLSLKFRGSKNQRIIDVQASLNLPSECVVTLYD